MTGKMYDDFREFLQVLETKGELVKVEKQICSKYELAAVQMKILKELDKAVLFTNVDGKGQQMVGNLYSSRRMISYMFGVEPSNLVDTILNIQNAKPVKVKKVNQAPCQEVVIRKIKEIKDYKEILPITWNSQNDSGYFLTAAIVICKDPDNGKVNSAICRFEYKKDHFTVQLVPNQHSWMIFQKYKARNQDMPVAVVLGADPIFMVASESGIPYEQNEFEFAGAILGRSFEVAQCKTVDLDIPAKAEFILEGHISVSQEEMEGPMGEVTQYYGGQSAKPVFAISCVTHHHNPISENIISGTIEEHALLAVSMEGRVLTKLRQVSPLVTSLNLLPFFFNCVIQIEDYPEVQTGIAKNVLHAALAEPWIKSAIIVNKDIDINCADDVNWAVATRVDFARDVIISDGLMGFQLDPMRKDSTMTVSKIGIDATVLPCDRKKFIRRWVVGYDTLDLADWVNS